MMIMQLNKITFSAIEILDWYDGPTCAVCKSDELDKWFFATLVFTDIQLRRRVFVLMELSDAEATCILELLLKTDKITTTLLTELLDDLVNSYDGNVWLLDTDNLDKESKTLVQVDKSYLRYFKSLDEVVYQDKEDAQRYLEVFEKD